MRNLICYVLLAGAAGHAQESKQDSKQDGKQAFATRCSVGHGVDGRGAERGPNLANNRRVRSRSLDELRAVIRNGIPASGMPAFDVPAAELNALTGFVRSLGAPASESNLPG